MTVSQEFRDAAYPQDSGEAFVFLLKIEHPDLEEPIRLTDSEYDLVVADEGEGEGPVTYIAAPFQLEPPGQTEDDPRGRLIVPNVDRRIGEGIDLISTPATVSIRQVLESDPTLQAGDALENLLLQEVRGTAESFEGSLNWPQFATEPWPKEIISPDRYRAAFRIL